MKSIVFQVEARQDALDAFSWYEERRAGLGALFREELDATLRRLAQHPEGYSPTKRGLRHAPVHRFPYAVYFRLLDESVIVVGVLHGRRHPSVPKAR